MGKSLPGIVLVGLVLSGCALLPGGGPAPLDTYELSAVKPEGGRSRRGSQILINQPSALQSIDAQNIVVEPAPGNIEYLKGAQWADRLPRVIQARLAESFQRSGRLGGVGLPGEGLAIDFQVLTEVRDFSISIGAAPRAEVEIYVKLMNDRDGVIRASRDFRAVRPVAGTGNDAYVAALDAAFGEVSAEIVRWTLASM
jgi:cholesterol transport system auxiliary component